MLQVEGESLYACKLFPGFSGSGLPVPAIVMNLVFSTVLLVSAVAVGLYLVYIGLRQRRRLPGTGLIHAGLALIGTIILFTEIFSGPTDKLNNIAALFLFFAVMGGGMVFMLHEENRPPSMVAITAHAIMGLFGISLLIINLF